MAKGNGVKPPKRVALLMGGWSAEREVSLVSGKECADALEQAGYAVTRVDVGREVKRDRRPAEGGSQRFRVRRRQRPCLVVGLLVGAAVEDVGEERVFAWLAGLAQADPRDRARVEGLARLTRAGIRYAQAASTRSRRR